MEGRRRAEGCRIRTVKETAQSFRRRVLEYHRLYGRHDLPWRTTTDPYAILVSEVMLQQTQVERVRPYFERWMRRFPDIETLAHASLTDVLKVWQGLGYNRRGKKLWECARAIRREYGGRVPRDYDVLVTLPAIGPYTAGAIRAFAFNKPGVFIETNIRAVLIHHFFPRTKKVPDAKLVSILEKITKEVKGPRKWYWALMDYGVLIKKKYPNPARRSVHYARQSKFEGSLRQMRGAIVRQLLEGPLTHDELLKMNTARSDHVERALESLRADGMIRKWQGTWRFREEKATI